MNWSEVGVFDSTGQGVVSGAPTVVAVGIWVRGWWHFQPPIQRHLLPSCSPSPACPWWAPACGPGVLPPRLMGPRLLYPPLLSGCSGLLQALLPLLVDCGHSHAIFVGRLPPSCH